MTSRERAYSEEEIAERLAKELPEWRYENGWIRRKFKTHTWPGTMLLVGAIGMLAEAAWHHPDLVVSYAFVEVKLVTHTAKGITDKDFELAHKLEETLNWRSSGAEEAPLAKRVLRGASRSAET
jgi:4a-hydroxytetrahydrobiopterin dehydratase